VTHQKGKREKKKCWNSSLSLADFGFHIDCIIIKVAKELGDLAR